LSTTPTSPIELAGTGHHFAGPRVEVTAHVVAELADRCEVVTDTTEVAEASRDWWPLALHWALAGTVPQLATCVARPRSTAEVAHVLRVCNEHAVPVTPAGGRSGVCGAAVPAFGGVVLDMTGLAGIAEVDAVSGVVEVLPGTFGPDLEDELRSRHDLTVGHFPQSFDLATVGGWIASRGAGQYSTRYGKIEDMVVGLEAVLADGTTVRTGGAPAAAVGPDLTQLLVGSEGTLAVITRAWLRAHPVPDHEVRAAYFFDSFADGLEVCRRVLRGGATPAVLRLYDAEEAARGHGGDGTQHLLLALDEGERTLIEPGMAILDEAADDLGGTAAPVDLVADWLEHRNDTSALQALTRRGYVVDTMEIAAPWSVLGAVFDRTRAALLAVPTTVAATCHLSHSYLDGACLYFTFAATPEPEDIESTYRDLWDAGQRAVLDAGGNLSHHHGIGINRHRFVRQALGSGLDVLAGIKRALDPVGILNPGKLGLDSSFGPEPWPPGGAR
jgi:alkyldihydroxyacetonephosphate synthase